MKTSSLKVLCSKPDQSLFFFEGVIKMPGKFPQAEITLENFLPRGAMMQGTGDGVLALVLYTGKDSKIVLN